jgi:hypothetical protein
MLENHTGVILKSCTRIHIEIFTQKNSYWGLQKEEFILGSSDRRNHIEVYTQKNSYWGLDKEEFILESSYWSLHTE